MAMNFPDSPTTGQTFSVSGGPTYSYDGSKWRVLTPGNQFARTTVTATAGQTSFSVVYTVGAIDVFLNGVKLVSGSDFTATTGTTIVLTNGANAGDTLEIVSYSQITYTAVSLTSNVTGTLPVGNGGTDQSSYTIGDILYASGTTALSKLAGVATGNALISGGVGTAPSWGKVGLTTHVSGTLPVANGGTGITSLGTGVATALGNNTNAASGLAVLNASGYLSVAQGGTGLGSLTVGYIPFGNGTGAFSNSANLFFDGTNLGVGTTSPRAISGYSSLALAGSNGGLFDFYSGSTRLGGIGADGGGINITSLSATSPITFTMNGSERARITSDGNLGIGGVSTGGNNRLRVVASGPADGDGNLLVENSSSSTSGDTNAQIIVKNKYASCQMMAWENNGLRFGTRTTSNGGAGNIIFTVNDGEKARITSDGNLLVGTTSSSNVTKLTSYNAGVACIVANTNTSNLTTPAFQVSKGDNNSTTSNVLVQFFVNGFNNGSGSITANGANNAAFGVFSDSRLKENIVDLPSQLANILALKPREFDYISGGHQIGFLAQEMQDVYPDVVGVGDDDGMLMIAGWSKTEARLVKAIQELAAKVSALEAKQ